MPWVVTKDGQKSWGGRSKLEVMQQAEQYQDEAEGEQVLEIRTRLEELNMFMKDNAKRMAP